MSKKRKEPERNPWVRLTPWLSVTRWPMEPTRYHGKQLGWRYGAKDVIFPCFQLNWYGKGCRLYITYPFWFCISVFH
jgi:hypothetical protein